MATFSNPLSDNLEAYEPLVADLSPEPSCLSTLPTTASQPAINIEAWLEAACPDTTSLWCPEDAGNAAIPALRAAELLGRCCSSDFEDFDGLQQALHSSAAATCHPSQQLSPSKACETPLLSPVHSTGFSGHVWASASEQPCSAFQKLDAPPSRSNTEELEDSCGGSTVSLAREQAGNMLPFAGRPRSPHASPHALHSLHQRESQPFSVASARGAAVPSETVLTSTSEEAASRDGPKSPDGEELDSELELPNDVAQALGNAAASGRLADLDPSLADSEASQQSEGYDDDLDSQEGSSDLEPGADLHYCTNCTARLPSDGLCAVCHRHREEDRHLFDSSRPAFPPQQPASAPQGTVLVWDERMQLHAEGQQRPHPERPDRIRAVMARLLSSNIAARCQQLPCREATAAEVAACHRPDLFARLEAASARAEALSRADLEDEEDSDAFRDTCVYFTPDTYANPNTGRCARLAAGASIDVAVSVATGKSAMGAAIVRPPGHHAESATPMGFCFFNNAALAAQAARAAGAKRVIILDFDVHHGNGTQHMFEEDPTVMYMSVHRYDGGHFYPGTGNASEVGRGPGEGFTVNIPWAMGDMGDADYVAAFTHVFLPIAYEYSPDIIVVSAGYDAAKGDPMGGCRVSSAGFAQMTAMLRQVAPLAVILEGGYNLEATAGGVEATMRVLLGERPPQLPASTPPATSIAMMVIHEVIAIQSRYWRCLQGLTQRLRFDPCTTHFPIPPLPHADPPVSRYNPQSPSTVPTKPAAHTTFSESAAAARGTALVSPASTDNNHHHHHHHHQQGVGDSRTDRGSTAKAPGGALGELRVTMPRLGSAEAVSSPTKAHSGQKSPHRRQFIRSKLQLGRFEGKRQRRWAITHALHLVALHTLVKRQALPRRALLHPRSSSAQRASHTPNGSPASPGPHAQASNGHVA